VLKHHVIKAYWGHGSKQLHAPTILLLVLTGMVWKQWKWREKQSPSQHM